MGAFGDFMKAEGHTDATAAAALKVSRPYVTKIRLGKRSPSLKLAARIEDWSGGRLPAKRLISSESGAPA